MPNGSAIPEDRRSPQLKNFLRHFSINIGDLDASLRHTPLSTNFLSLCIAAIDESAPIYKDERITPFRKHLLSDSSTVERIKRCIEQFSNILATDTHLKICCDNPFNLAYVIDKYFLEQVYKLKTLSVQITEAQFEILYREFESIIYQDSYTRNAFFHLYNFDFQDENIIFEDVNITKLEDHFIPKLFRESNYASQIHYGKTGNFFLKYSDTEAPKEYPTWLDQLQDIARNTLSLLQNFQDGVIDNDYYTIYFTPDWVNDIWRAGFYHYGQVRNTPSVSPYKLESNQVQVLSNYRKVQISKFQELRDASSNLGNVIARTQKHFSNFHSKESKEEQFIELLIALESLFSPEDKIELSFRISLYAAMFLATEVIGLELFEFLKEIQRKRGKLIHGSYKMKDIQEDRFISDDDMMKLASIVRKSLLGFIVLYLRGETKRENIHKRLNKSLFLTEDLNNLHEKSNPDIYIDEILATLI